MGISGKPDDENTETELAELQQERKPVPKSWGDMVFYSERKLRRTVQILSVLFAAFALTAAIICLSITETTAQRFGAFGGFLFVFVLVIGTMTTAKTSEMLTAAAAYVLCTMDVDLNGHIANDARYAAVLVVFIGTGLEDKKS